MNDEHRSKLTKAIELIDEENHFIDEIFSKI